jgi:hypothetical protein
MATVRQIEANRRNAQKSTGPRTTEGKAAVRLNALKHGVFAEEPVILGEDPDAFHAIRQAFLERFQPAGAEEEILVFNLIRNAWLLERFAAVELDIWDDILEVSDPKCNTPLSRGHNLSYTQLKHLQRRLDSAHRNYRRDLELLVKLQKGRSSPSPAPPEPKPIVQPAPTEIGFVPVNPQDRQPAQFTTLRGETELAINVRKDNPSTKSYGILLAPPISSSIASTTYSRTTRGTPGAFPSASA